MGRDKARLAWRGRPAIDVIAQVASEAGAGSVVTVGPNDYGYPIIVERTPGGGPVGGIVEACSALRRRGCSRALFLACDAPALTSGDLAPLLASPAPGAAYEGLHLPLVIDLARVPHEAAPGWSLRRLIAEAGLVLVPPGADAVGRLRGANTPGELSALRRRDEGAVK
jgi:molybdopterin-guanine dinucleotide biosynthesis protein A